MLSDQPLQHTREAAPSGSARKDAPLRAAVPNVDQDAPIESTLDFRYQVFAEDIEMLVRRFPDTLP